MCNGSSGAAKGIGNGQIRAAVTEEMTAPWATVSRAARHRMRSASSGTAAGSAGPCATARTPRNGTTRSDPRIRFDE
jgi:hypothetical protein